MMKREIINFGTLDIRVGKIGLESKARVLEYKNTDCTSDLNSLKNCTILSPHIWQKDELPAAHIHQ